MGIIDAFFKRFKAAGPASHALGSVLIDGVWSTSDIAPSLVPIFPHISLSVFARGAHVHLININNNKY